MDGLVQKVGKEEIPGRGTFASGGKWKCKWKWTLISVGATEFAIGFGNLGRIGIDY